MSNARSFLEGGRFAPADNTATMPNLLHLSRVLRDIDPTRPMRFVLVEGADQFKPEYWNRVVAVFTTGQAWQFKSYKWTTPAELFRRVPGVYLGWRGDQPPETIRNWGQRVLSIAIDRWREAGPGVSADAARFRDKEVVEQVWRMIELNMIARGWRRDSGPTPV
jgi:parafibromin